VATRTVTGACELWDAGWPKHAAATVRKKAAMIVFMEKG
jgi:hypothetical protein